LPNLINSKVSQKKQKRGIRNLGGKCSLIEQLLSKVANIPWEAVKIISGFLNEVAMAVTHPSLWRSKSLCMDLQINTSANI
jgi:hypothetical protein